MDDGQPKVEGHDGLMWIRGSGVCRDWNGIRYKLGMSGKNVGAKELSMNVAMIPPGGVAEQILGKALASRRTRAFITTKTGNPVADGSEASGTSQGLSRKHIRAQIEPLLTRALECRGLI